jgi:hypothetical protein
MPRHGVHLILPIHYPVKGADDLVHLVQDQQRQMASILGIDDSFAGVPYHGAYEHVFRLIHLELSMRVRVLVGKSNRGLVGMIKRAAVDVLGVKEDYVAKLHDDIKRCRRGERSRASWHRRPR